MDLNVASVGVTLGPQGRLPKQEPTLACVGNLLPVVPIDAAGLAGAGWAAAGATDSNAGIAAVNAGDAAAQHLHLLNLHYPHFGFLILVLFHCCLCFGVAFGSKSYKILFKIFFSRLSARNLSNLFKSFKSLFSFNI